jgi:gamma-glutamylcyclotransferase (GGCT)/AIG2-like uncharacterized protein YtfP
MSEARNNPDQLLFSYGTLQQSQVQQATFGRLLEGFSDQLPGFSLTMLEITDPQVIAISGKTHHPIISYTGNPENKVDGIALLVSAQELQQADRYEVADYIRKQVELSSGAKAWVYVAANEACRLD